MSNSHSVIYKREMQRESKGVCRVKAYKYHDRGPTLATPPAVALRILEFYQHNFQPTLTIMFLRQLFDKLRLFLAFAVVARHSKTVFSI